MHYAKKLVALLESLRAQVDAAVREGATLKDVRKRVTLEEFVKPFAGDEPARAAAFRAFFVPSD